MYLLLTDDNNNNNNKMLISLGAITCSPIQEHLHSRWIQKKRKRNGAN